MLVVTLVTVWLLYRSTFTWCLLRRSCSAATAWDGGSLPSSTALVNSGGDFTVSPMAVAM